MKEDKLYIDKLYLNNQLETVCFESMPKLTWKVRSEARNDVQVAYQYQVSTTSCFTRLLLDSGRVESDRSANVKTDALVLKSSTTYFVRVRCWNSQNRVTDWKEANFLTGIVNEPWLARYITCGDDDTPYEQQAFYIKKCFNIERINQVKSVTVHATAGGIYQAYFNESEVIDGVLKPGFTSYKENHLYQSADITDQIKEQNVITMHVGAGWYCGRLGWLGDSALYAEKPGVICQIVVRYESGEEEVIASNDTWQYKASPVVFSSIYDGEIYDARKESSDWNQETLSNDDWKHCQVVPFDERALKPQTSSGIKFIETLKPKSILKTPKEETVVDFGQNISGVVELEISGNEGEQVTIEHFEVLDQDGNVHTENLRTAAQKNTFIIGANKQYRYVPHFTFQGFRYVKITKSCEDIVIDQIEATVLHTEMEQTGHFECSNSLLNKLHENIRWGMRGNFVDIPTDCPQRDERLGWTGDAQIFSKTACYLYDSQSFFSKWLVDVRCDQLPEGGIPFVVPDTLTGRVDDHPFFKKSTHSAAGWGDAIVIIPWHMYLMYGDTDVLRENYQSMCDYIYFVENQSVDYVFDIGIQFGDWLALDAEKGSFFGGTPTRLTGTAYFAYSTKLLAQIAGILGYEKGEEYFSQLYSNIHKKFVSEFIGEFGERVPKTQTSHILPLYFDLVSAEQKPMLASGLVSLIEKNGGHLNTGFLGTPHICDALSDNGYPEAAYSLLLKDSYPSWLHQVKLGATTVWEHWDGIQADGALRDPGMNSFNHYAYGAVGQWLYSNILGIKPIESTAGFQTFCISPRLTKKLNNASGSYSTAYGDIKSSWEKRDAHNYLLEIEVPFNSSAIVKVEGYTITTVDGDTIKDRTEIQLGSGHYKIEVMATAKEVACI
ncbi:alpha-L-rhamnosidase [Vibrio agarivorans]|uniref:alpha-L-rhamnosidase n=1 Tax=Vibrio agarivorans TaxID=153622 RepID=UPI00222F3735|nr:alpha-L-rhamnosidase [Vibrio agarivorans]